jgi:hypothetical protein
MRIEDALSQLRTIQNQVDRTEAYCCYRAATVAVSGLIAIGAAAVQSSWVESPIANPQEYLRLWVGVAAVSIGIISVEIFVRWLRNESERQRQRTIAAVRQFLPCVIAGALVTWAIIRACPEHAALFPAIWAIMVSMGIFSSATCLPTGGAAVGAYYLLAGLACITFGHGAYALSPWTMAVTFGVGQLLAAVMLCRQENINAAA